MIKIEKDDDGRKGKFRLFDDDALAGELEFTWAGDDKFILDHTEVDRAFSGRGFGKKLVAEAVDYARKKEIRILPLCPFAKRLFDLKKEWDDVRV